MQTHRFQLMRSITTGLAGLVACVALIGAPLTTAQAPAAAPAGQSAPAPSPEQLEQLVGPIALYPDELVAIILPASTNPLQIVQVDRFLQKRKQDPKLPIDDNWDEAVKNLANYPDVIKKMSDDLDWTSDLGEAVVADQGAVLSAIQAFRRKAQSAGNLKTDEKQKVEVEKEIIKIVPADPQVIYVPQYNPTTVVTYSTAPVYGYYPAPYPAYYYPYAPGAAFATGLIWGAAIGAAWGGAWGVGWGNNEININRNTNINTGDINRGDRGQGNRPSQGGQGSAWKSDKKPGQVRTGGTRPTSTAAGSRVGDRPGGGGAGGAGSRPGAGGGGAGGFGGGAGAGAGAGGRPTQTGGAGGRDFSGAGASASPRTSAGAGGGGRDAFGGYGSGSAARADSSRGASSRSSMSGGSYGGGGGARAGGGSYGGGARGGGGGGRGGGGGGRGGGGRR